MDERGEFPFLARDFMEGRLTRREFLRASALLGLSGVAAAFVAACGASGTTPVPTVAATTASAAASAAAPSSKLNRPLRLHHDSAVGPLYEPYIADFNKRYAPLQVETSYVTGDYPVLTQAQLAGGNVDYDILFADDGFAQKWFNAGWIRALDDIDGIKDLLADLQPGIEANCRTPDGKLITVPYYRGVENFIYNKEHLDKINATVPKTWDEFVATCTELKAKGVTDTPYSPFWGLQFTLIWTELNAEVFSDGGGPFFDDKLKPVFKDDPVVASTLERWKGLLSKGLVPQDVFTTDYGGTANIFAGAKSSFIIRYGPQLKQFTDPAQSKSASGAKNAPMPGKTGTTLDRGAWWMMTSSTPDPQTAWQLMKYLAWKDKDGVYYFSKNLLAINLGLQTAYSAVNNDPEVKAAWSKWCDADVLLAQIKNSKSLGPVVLAEWYGDFTIKVSSILQDAVRGTKPIPQALSEAAALVPSS
jgi:ABC-type glycerol-3-phosphate transport system substrate-binding protein